MKKAKKGRRKPPRPKVRAKPKQTAPARPRPVDAAPKAFPAASTSPFGASFDFTAPAAPATDLVASARERLQAGDARAALSLCRETLRADPGNAVALNLAGIAAFQCGLGDEALDMLETALAFEPGNAETRTNYGNVLARLGRPSDAEHAYEDAMRADPRYADAPYNLGILHEAAGRHGQALEAFDRTIAISPVHTGARAGRGDALKGLKRLDEARAAYEDALRRDGSLAHARTNLAAVLQELGDFAGALDQSEKALETVPRLVEARYNAAIALQELSRHEEAIAAYRDVLEAQPGNAAASLNIAYGLQQLGRLDDAAAELERTLLIDPDFAKAHVNLADIRLQQGDPRAALAVCDAFLARRPGEANALAMKALALTDMGENDTARRLVDFDRFLQIVHIEPPEEYQSMEAFNAALSEHVESHPTLTFAPRSHATREGRHSGELLSEPKGPILHLEQAIMAAADAWRARLGRDPDHPFIAAPPKQWALSVWGVVMRSAGHQIPHIHPAAWLSGVYYAKLPDVVARENADQAGWIEFGRPPEHFHNRVAPETRAVRPEEGAMVLFPSYFYHDTIPFADEGARISIAFDLMPVGR